MIIIKPFLLGLFIIVCSATLIQNEDHMTSDRNALPFLPLYIGKGYHVLFGNPKNNGTDPGFLEQVF